MREIFHSVGWAVNKIASDYGIDFDNQIFEQARPQVSGSRSS